MLTLFIAAALGGQGASFVEPPRIDRGAVVARIALEDPALTGDSLGSRMKLVLDGETKRAKGKRAVRSGVATVLSFDASGSFRKYHDRAFDLADAYRQSVLDKEAVGIMVFGRTAEAWAPSLDPLVVEANLNEARELGAVQKETRLAAFIKEAVEASNAALPGSRGGVRRVVVFTDAGEESQVFDVDEIAEFAQSRRVIVDAIVFARQGSGSYAEDLDRIARLTHLTGGDVLEIHGTDTPTDAMAGLASRVRNLYDVRARYCGETVPSVTLVAPGGVHTDAVVASGQPVPCTEVPEDTDVKDPKTPVEPPVQAPTGPSGKLAGLMCLLLALLVMAFLGAAAWLLASRDQAREDDPPPPPPKDPPVAPSAPTAPPEEDPEQEAETKTENAGFSMHLPETHLKVVQGDLPNGTRWRFAGRILRVGASAEENEVVVDLPQISSRHARFELFPSGAVFVEDLGSSNGTWVGTTRIRPNVRTEVPAGSRVALSSQLVVVVEQPHQENA